MKPRTMHWAFIPHSMGLAATTACMFWMVTGCESPSNSSLQETGSTSGTLSTNQFRVGDISSLQVSVTHSKNSSVAFPNLNRDKELVVRNHQVDLVPLSQTLMESRASWEITSFRTGEFVISTNSIMVKNEENESGNIPFPFLSYSVHSVLEGDDEALREPKGLVSWASLFPRWILLVGGILLLALLVGLLFAWVIHKKPLIKPLPPPPPAHIVARDALRKLQGKGLIEKGAYEPFTVEISAIIRLYLDQRFSIHAPDRTTEDLLREAGYSEALSLDHQMLCRRFLEACDQVKFARHLPGQQEMEGIFDAATQLIEDTHDSSPSLGEAAA